MTDPAPDDLPEPIAQLLREAMAAYSTDPVRGDFLLDYACTQAADPLPLYRVLYKFHNRRRQFDHARGFAARALNEAARRAGLRKGPEAWTGVDLAGLDPMLASQILLALKALAFIALRGGKDDDVYLDALQRLDPEDGSGASVVAALAESVRAMG